MKKFLLTIIGISTLAFTALLLPLHPENSFAATNHVVISEIQTAGDITTDEFIELYNPTNTDIDITNWKLYKKTAAGTEEILVATATGNMPAHGFYLFAHTDFDAGVSPDVTYSENFSNDNSVILRDENDSLIDLVGMGDALTNETTAVTGPIANRSIERKANSTSTALDMTTGGVDKFNGNGEDTDNNFQDFVRHASPTISNPQNSGSDVEPTITSPTPSVEPSPTIEPTATPKPTVEPSPTLEPTEEPSPTPSIEPSPTLEPTTTPTPTDSPKIFSSNPIITCTVKYRGMKVFGKTFYFPLVTCFRT